jgi:hypothetical protein
MIFNLIRYCWPNTAAVAALAALPLVAIVLPGKQAMPPTDRSSVGTESHHTRVVDIR